MNILAIDTSSKYLCLSIAKDDKLLTGKGILMMCLWLICSKYLCLSIAKDDKLVAGMRRPFARELSGKIIPSIDAALKQSKVSLKAIDYFGIGFGPGSFTGLRIGLAAVKGLIFPFRKPIIGVGSLDLLARAVSNHSGLVCPIVDAR